MEKFTPQSIDRNLLRAAVYANNLKPVDPWIQSTGLRTNALRQTTLGYSNESRIAEDFLINSQLRRNDREIELSVESYFTDAGVVMLSMLGQEEQPGFREQSLPKSAVLRMELGEAFSWRRSIRNYTGDSMDLDYLAAMTRSAAGITCHVEVDLMRGGQSTLKFRTAPSAGGLYPIDLFLAVSNVQALERGLYRYDPIKDVLWQTGDQSDLENLLLCFAAPDEVISIRRANVIFLLVGQPWRSMRKYGNRGMRFLFLEAGSIAQNINLAAVALGFGSVDCSSIYDDEAHEAMHLDGLYQTLLHTVVVGTPG